MKINNYYNLPPGLVSIIRDESHPPKKNRFGTTQLIGPPLIRTLLLEKWDDLESDVSDYLWALLGTGVDKLVSSATDAESVRQHKMEREIGDYTLVGVADVINDDILADWKCTSCWSYLNGIKPEWVAQLNVYDWMYSKEKKKDDVPIRHLKIYAILRDWQKSKVVDPNYPKIPFQISYIPQWTREQQEGYINSRILDHTSNPYRECTPEEKWQRDTTYAVKSKGKKRAERVLDSSVAAEEWMKKNRKGDYIETRKGVCIRCSDYCPVRGVCKYRS